MLTALRLAMMKLPQPAKPSAGNAHPSRLTAKFSISGALPDLQSGQKRKEWEKRFKALDPEIKGQFERRMRGELPSGFDDAMLAYKQKLADEKPTMATRKSSETVLERHQCRCARNPWRFG